MPGALIDRFPHPHERDAVSILALQLRTLDLGESSDVNRAHGRSRVLCSGFFITQSRLLTTHHAVLPL